MNKVLKAEPGNAELMQNWVRNYAATHDSAQAILELQKAIELDPSGVEYYISLAALEFRSVSREQPKRLMPSCQIEPEVD